MWPGAGSAIISMGQCCRVFIELDFLQHVSDIRDLKEDGTSKTAIFRALESFKKFAVLKSGKLKSITL